VRLDLPPASPALARRGPAWAAWLDRLPRSVDDVCAAWQLVPDGEPRTGRSGLLLPVRSAAGTALLKLGWPHPEAAHEHLALRAWGGGGAVTLLRADPHRAALLLERADPGSDLSGLAVDEACEVVAGLYGRLHRPPVPQLDRLSQRAARWSEELAALRGSALAPRRFVDQAAALAADFAADPGTDAALLHGDLHFGNVLAVEREPGWLAVNAEPLAGDPAYELAPLLWHRWDEAVATQDLRGALLDRLYRVVDGAELDEDRARDWVTVRAMVAVLETSRETPVDQEAVTLATTIVKAVQR
jgi:streptomycin 6-kinase